MADEAAQSLDGLYVASRRAYEVGRIHTAIRRSSVVTMCAAGVAWLAVDRFAPVWLVLTFATWLAVEWRGLALRRGARYGLAVGVITLLLPLSLLRPCCRAGAAMPMGDCCTQPSACWMVGGALGLLLAWVVPRGPIAQRLETAFGMCAGVAAVAMLRCSGLYVGEAAGLMGGLLAGLVTAGTASAVYTWRRSARV